LALFGSVPVLVSVGATVISPRKHLNGGKGVLGRQMGISHRHLNALMPHHLHRTKVDPGHHEATCKGMPEAVPREAATFRFLDGWLKAIAGACPQGYSKERVAFHHSSVAV